MYNFNTIKGAKMIEKISQKIISIISYIPGIASFANIDFEKRDIELKPKEYQKSFMMQDSEKGNVFMIAIIINRNTRAKIICREILSQLEKLFKEENIDFKRINVYIRGVK